MKVTLFDLNGENTTIGDVDEYRFANHETYGLTDKLEKIPGENLLIINANNFVSLLVED